MSRSTTQAAVEGGDGRFEVEGLDQHLHAAGRPAAGDGEEDAGVAQAAHGGDGLVGEDLVLGDQGAVDVGQEQADGRDGLTRGAARRSGRWADGSGGGGRGGWTLTPRREGDGTAATNRQAGAIRRRSAVAAPTTATTATRATAAHGERDAAERNRNGQLASDRAGPRERPEGDEAPVELGQRGRARDARARGRRPGRAPARTAPRARVRGAATRSALPARSAGRRPRS